MGIWMLLSLVPAITAAETMPTTFPIFLRAGFSSVLEFEDVPTKVVLGNAQAFQVDRLDNSLVVKTLAPDAVTNMFVYFKTRPTRLFVLTANEDAEPTYYRKFESLVPPKLQPKAVVPITYAKGLRLSRASFDAKKDYLTVEAVISSNSSAPILPDWDLVRLVHGNSSIKPVKLWSERKEIQKDASVKARFIFAKPNIPRNLKNAAIVVPVKGDRTAMRLHLEVGDEKSE